MHFCNGLIDGFCFMEHEGCEHPINGFHFQRNVFQLSLQGLNIVQLTRFRLAADDIQHSRFDIECEYDTARSLRRRKRKITGADPQVQKRKRITYIEFI